MALCLPMNPILNEKSTPFYPQPSLHEIRTICQTTLKKFLDIDITNHIQLAERFVRSLSVGGILPMSTGTKIYSRTNSLFVRQIEILSQCEQSNKYLEKDSCFTAIENEFDFVSIPEDDNKRHYSTKKPYECPSQEYILSSPPIGYKPICVQLLARHGSRSLNGHDYDLQTLKIWQLAKQKNMLTTLGEQLKEDIELFMAANNHVGRGELTKLGKEEHFGIGTRLYNRLKTLFISSNKISVITSGKKRAMESAEEFINGLKNCQCNIEILNENPNKNLLYFHKLCEDYMTFKKNDLNIKTKINLIKNLEQTKIYSQQVLKRIYKNEFVQLLINGNYQFQSDENINPDKKDKINNEVDIVLCLYSMFLVAPAQNQPRLGQMLAKYFNQEESNWFAYINDAQEFYVKGPSIQGTTITYDMAKPLLADFFSSINACIESKTNVTAHLRFAHAETVIPFATLLQIPNLSDKAVDPLDLYTYENNQWRGDRIAPMAANIQWEIYQHEDNSQKILVRMLYNEMEVRFKQDCQSLTPNSFFYDLNELKRSYANHLLSSNSDMN